MTDYPHVTDPLIRSVLDGDISEDALCYALSETMEAALKDLTHPEVPSAVAEKRLALAEDASDWWNQEGNAFEALDCLRKVWMT